MGLQSCRWKEVIVSPGTANASSDCAAASGRPPCDGLPCSSSQPQALSAAATADGSCGSADFSSYVAQGAARNICGREYD